MEAELRSKGGDRIRLARIDDIPRILQMAYGFHEDAIRPLGLGYSPADFGAYLVFLIQSPIASVFVLEGDLEGEGIQGTIAGLISPWFMQGSDVILTEQWVWVEPEARGGGAFSRLLEALTQWGVGLGATKLCMVAIGSSTEEQVREFYARRGFTYMETHFIKDLSSGSGARTGPGSGAREEE
jgi:GNAT superfamily N-acetyltransferase